MNAGYFIEQDLMYQTDAYSATVEPSDEKSTLQKEVEDDEDIDCLMKSFLKQVSNGAKIRNRYNQVPHLTQDTNGKVTNSQETPQTRAKRSALSQQVTTKHI